MKYVGMVKHTSKMSFRFVSPDEQLTPEREREAEQEAEREHKREREGEGV
jgi:hypothetical protein